MRAEKIRISNFRSLRDVEVGLDGLTVLIGANSSGKTSVLEALRMFGDDHIKLSKDDFFPGTDTMEISVTIDPEGDAGVPQEYLIGGKVTLKMVAELEDGGRVVELSRVEKMCIGDLVGVRDKRTARERQAEMKKFSAEYPGLRPTDAWPGNLNSYEHDHLGDADCQGRYVRHFIDVGQSEFGAGGLLDIMYVPAVRDIEADAMDDGDSLLSELIDMAIRGTGKYDARLEKIIDMANRKVKKLMRTVDREGGRLAKEIRERALLYADNTGFELEFVVPGLKNARPRATLTFKEDGLPIPMDRVGNGVQRVYLIALLETIYSVGDRRPGKGRGRARVILIDEPELYQHPQRQSRILRVLGGMAKKSTIQVVCSTHSPYFVWLEEIGRVRRLQKEGRETKLRSTSIGRIVKCVNSAGIRSRPVSEVRMAALLDLASSRWIAEGLFARMAVLVEGPGDRSMLLATARAMKVSLDELEVAIVPCQDKFSIANVFQVYCHLGVPVYLVWDTDSGGKDGQTPRLNRGLQRLADPDTPDGQDPMIPRFGPRYSCPDANLSDATIEQVGGIGGLLAGRMRYYGLNPRKKGDKKMAVSNQRIMYDILRAAKRDRGAFGSLPSVKILGHVVKMREGLSDRDAAGRGEGGEASAAEQE